MISLYNSLTKRKEEFKPIETGKIRMYVCGITVYDYCHIGHARSMVVFDVIVRFLRWAGFRVTFVKNITDIDDKIINRANENGEQVRDLTDRFIELMHADERALNVLPPDIEPRATESMEQIIAMVKRLLDKGFAYHVENGDVYFEVRKFGEYGRLAGRDLEKEQAGARVEIVEDKRDPLDFVLWKSSKPGEPSWDSPWGPGRPGWHIECSAMSTHYLGEHFDIHGGGMDLKFPHHENEIAQSCAANDKPFANYWLHNGLITVDGKKMSKSDGNYIIVDEVLKSYRPEAVRYFFLTSQYASPLNYSDSALRSATESLSRLYTAIRDLDDIPATANLQSDPSAAHFRDAMSDDFNTPGALAVLFELAKMINRHRESGALDKARQAAACLKELASVFGLLQQDPEEFFQGTTQHSSEESQDTYKKIMSLIAEREQARNNRDFNRSDQIRDQLKDMGVVLEDGPNGTTWRWQK